MYKFLFDFDGVLVDSMTMWARAVIELLEKNGVSYPGNLIEIVTPLGNEKTADYLITLGLDMSAEDILKYIGDIAVREYTYNIPAKKGVKEALELLKNKGYSLNVLTASPHPVFDICLKRLELYGYFDNHWSCDDFGMPKTNPLLYKEAAERLGADVKNCVVLDDNLVAVTTAKTAGMKVAAVYDETSKQYEKQMRETADFYAFSLENFENILKGVGI